MSDPVQGKGGMIISRWIAELIRFHEMTETKCSARGCGERGRDVGTPRTSSRWWCPLFWTRSDPDAPAWRVSEEHLSALAGWFDASIGSSFSSNAMFEVVPILNVFLASILIGVGW